MPGARHKKVSHIIETQSQAEEAFLKELRSGSYTHEHPLIAHNLYGINPLSAVIAFYTEEETAVTVTVLGKQAAGNIAHTFPKAREHVLPVCGLYSDYENKVEIRLYQGNAVTVTIPVPDVFDGKKVMDFMDTSPEYLKDQLLFVTPASEDLATAFDYAGDARWHMNVPCVFAVKQLKNGNLLMGSSRLIQMPYYMAGLYEIAPCGKIYKEFRVPGGYHHDQFEMPDGNLLCLTEDLLGDTVEDMCVLLDRETGEILKTWDFKDILPVGEGKSGSWSEDDWFHCNAVWYDENTDSLTFSGRHMDSIINIDYESGVLNWILGDPAGWPKEWVSKYFFTPVGANFSWQYEQHACLVTPGGDVMCFDNHHWGSKKKEEYKPAKESFSRGVRYRIDTKKRTIEQVWQYGRDLGAAFYSPYISNVNYYGEGHYLIHSGGIAYDKEGNPSEVLGTLAKVNGCHMYSVTVELMDGKQMLKMQVPGNYYRAVKLSLYKKDANLTLGPGKLLGSMGITKELDFELPATWEHELLPDSFEARIEEESDRFVFYGTFEKGQAVELLLEQGDEVHRYYISTAAIEYQAMCCGTFLEEDGRKAKLSVNKAGLSGAYDVRVIINDKKYDAGVQITCG